MKEDVFIMLKNKILKKGISILSVGVISMSGVLTSTGLQVKATKECFKPRSNNADRMMRKKAKSNNIIKKFIEKITGLCPNVLKDLCGKVLEWCLETNNNMIESSESVPESDSESNEVLFNSASTQEKSDKYVAFKKAIKKLKNNDVVKDLLFNMPDEIFKGSISILKEIILNEKNEDNVENDVIDIVFDQMNEEGFVVSDEVQEEKIVNYFYDKVENSVIESSEPVSESDSESNEKSVGVAGISNMGVSCYLNAALQQLYANTEFRNAVLAKNWNDEYQPMLSFLKTIFVKLQNGELVGTAIMNRSRILKLYEGNQEDSAEFYNLIMERAIGEGLTYNSFVKNTETYSDLNGEKIDSLVENSPIVQFSVSSGENLSNIFHNKEYMDNFRDNKAIKTTEITNDPNTLVISLNRYNNGLTKNTKELNVDKQLYHPNGSRYNLKAITVHIGETMNSGHYVAFVYNSNNDTWTLFNDGVVTENLKDNSIVFGTTVTVKDLISRNATMATYEKAV